MAEAADVRRINRAAILAALLRNGVRQRAALSASTGLSSATVSRVIDDLVREELVEVSAGDSSGRRGRPIDRLDVRTHRGVAIGVDLGADRCHVTACDLIGRTVVQHSEATARRSRDVDLADWIADRIAELIGDMLPDTDYLATVVVADATVARDGRQVLTAAELPQLVGTAFAERLHERVGGIVELDNDVHAALQGELVRGAARGAPVAVLVRLGERLGAAHAISGHIIPGERGLVGALGLVPSAIAGAASVSTTLSALAVMTIAYDPDVIVLAGTPADQLDDAAITRLAADLAATVPSRPRVIWAELGEYAAVVGAETRALDLLYISLGMDPVLSTPSPVSPPTLAFPDGSI